MAVLRILTSFFLLALSRDLTLGARCIHLTSTRRRPPSPSLDRSLSLRSQRDNLTPLVLYLLHFNYTHDNSPTTTTMDSNDNTEPEASASRSSTLHRDVTLSAPVWTPDSAITDLPNEILRDMFLAIDGRFSKTLYSLSLTCKRFRDVVKGGCEPEYNLRGKRIDDPFALMERLIGTKASGTHLQSRSFTYACIK
jgi:hypothetical protein